MSNPSHPILLIDDDPDVLWILGKSLTRAGFKVTTCADGREAISLLGSWPYEVVITDIAMPGTSGLAVADWIRKNRPRILVVVMTGIGSPAMKELTLLKGAGHYLEKPVDPEFLVDIVSKAVNGNGFRAVVDDMDVLDYIQLVMLTGKRVLIEIISKNGIRGLLFMDQGNIVHATCGGREGEEAFYSCMNFEGGRFSNLPWSDPGKRTIERPGEYMLFEAARRRDEFKGNNGTSK